MIARSLVGGLMLIGAALLIGCGGASHGSSATPKTAATGRKPDATVSLTVHYPTNLIRAMKRGSSKRARSPKFIDPGTYNGYSPLIEINSGITVCAQASPGPDGTQTISDIPIYSYGGSVSVQEFQDGTATANPDGTQTCTVNDTGTDQNGNAVAVTLAETPNGGIAYSGGFSPGTDVAFSTLFPSGIVLDGYATQYIYSYDSYNWYELGGYTLSPDGKSGTGQLPNALCTSEPTTLVFAAADANGVGVGAAGVTSVSGSSTLSGGFPSVIISNVIIGPNGPSDRSSYEPGGIQFNQDDNGGSATFNLSLTDYLGNMLPTLTETATVETDDGYTNPTCYDGY